MAGLTGISGLVAGFDTKGAVEELLSPMRARIDTLEQKKAAESAKQEAFGKLNQLLLGLRDVARGLSSRSDFFPYVATMASNNANMPAEKLIDVSGTSSVLAGSHTIVVHQLAAAQKIASGMAVKNANGVAVSSETTPLGLSGTFSIQGVNISVTATDSLKDIVNAINDAATGVTASTLKVSDNDFRLVLTADATGSAGFSISGAALDVGGALEGLQMGGAGQSNAYSTLVAPADAQVTIDGLTITRSTNEISDALSGITLTLKQADPSTTVTMNVDVDGQGVREKIQSFIDAYNEVMDFINEQYKFDENTQKNGILAGEPLLGSIQATLASSLLQAVPNLASDRNNLVLIGIEPDANGRLSINEDRFSTMLNNDPSAIRDVFVATGSSSNSALQFLTSGFDTPSGTYSVNITQAAARGVVTGTADLVTSGLAVNETVTITETGTSRQAVVSLSAGQFQSDIVNALNLEFSRVYTEKHQLSNALMTSGGVPATRSSTFADLGLGVAAGDTITISGTTRTGAAVSGSFTILDPAVDTISDLLAAIQAAFNQQVTASVDAAGHIVVSDNQQGDSQITIGLVANNEGGGTLDFGTDTVVTEGRYALGLEAIAAGNGVAIQTKNYGSSAGFSISQSVNGLGIADQTVSGVDVGGTINGLAATGAGQVLTGSEGAVDGLSLLYTGSATGNVGEVVVGVGIGSRLDGLLDTFANPVLGLIQNSIETSVSASSTLDKRIADIEASIERKREQLLASFRAMEQAMAALQSTGDFLTQQINALSSRK